jgi:3'-5' exoribonuclease
LALRDRTGSIPAKMWDNFEALAKTFEADDVVQIRGRVKLYNGQKEMTLEQIVPAAVRDYDLSDFLAHTKHDVEKLFGELSAAVAVVKNPWIKRLLEGVLNDSAIVLKLKRAPAAMSMHHAFVGGLLEHTVSLIGLGRVVAAHYPELNFDVLLAGIVLHDIGKIDELSYERATNYTTAGRLLGHITIGTLLVREKIKAIPGFPEPLAILIEHLILSHHGTYEFGSPSLPQTREAIALHFLDDMDSKMAAMRTTLEGASGNDEWTERNPALHRALLRTDKFLPGEDAVRSAEATASNSAQRNTTSTSRNPGGAR